MRLGNLVARRLYSNMSKYVSLDKFALRQFGQEGAVGQITMDPSAFADKVNEEIGKQGGLENALKPGYADFCKHVFVENFCGAQCLDLEITDQNANLLKTAYEARRENELPVLVRFFREKDVSPVPQAKYLDIILYSREQIRKETASMGESDDGETAPYGIISIKPQNVDYELPMQPITMLRNALGKEEGGSGVPLEKDKYMEAVQYWSNHAPIKA